MHQRGILQRPGVCGQQAARLLRRCPGPALPRTSATATLDQGAATAVIEDKFLAANLPKLHDQPAASGLSELRAAAWAAAATLCMPTARNEEFRFTDLSLLLRSSLEPASGDAPVDANFVAGLVPTEAARSHVVLVNGVFHPGLSNTAGLPAGVYVGGTAGAPAAALQHLGALAASRGGPFSVVNAVAARDALVVAVPAGASVETPLYVLHLSTAGQGGVTATSAPRLLLHAAEGSTVQVVEEWAAAEYPANPSKPPYFVCGVSELILEPSATVSHQYVVREAQGAAHIKATLVQQAASSSYSLTEARLGGSLTRHDVVVTQVGPSTSTSMRHFLLATAGQLHDLHTKLGLDHPEGTANQLHKCIVAAASGRGVFDGNVRVGKGAQRTDAGQLSRNLLLAPRATVNVKPNLQIIADDVKCTHGCAVSDLSEEELFYFRARGISALAARQALVVSFGAEVTRDIRGAALQARVQDAVRSALQTVDLAALI